MIKINESGDSKYIQTRGDSVINRVKDAVGLKENEKKTIERRQLCHLNGTSSKIQVCLK